MTLYEYIINHTVLYTRCGWLRWLVYILGQKPPVNAVHVNVQICSLQLWIHCGSGFTVEYRC